MAAASTLQYGRQKKNVYGKASKSNWSTTFFDGSDDELAAPAPPQITKPSTQQSASVKASFPVQKTENRKAPSPKVAKAKAVKQDTFDVPSSGDDEPSPERKVVRKPAFRSKRLLVDDRTGEKTKLAPWEREEGVATTSGDNGVTKKNQISATSPENQLRTDLVGAARSVAHKRESASKFKSTSEASRSRSALSSDHSRLSSASARLAARKRAAETNASADELSRSRNDTRAPGKAASEGTPRKRAKTTDTSRGSSVDVIMTDDAALPLCDGSDNAINSGNAESGIYDFPDSSADESAKPRQRSKSPRITKKPARRSKPNTHSVLATTRKGLSAPARLSEMLPTDSDLTEASTASPPASVGRASTPHRPSTPPSNKRPGSSTTFKSRGNITPKQAQLWDRLLPSQAVAPSPSALAMKDLTISGQKEAGARTSTAKRAVKSQPDVGRRRTRLVDRLKASAQSSSEDESDESSSESEDVAIPDAADAVLDKPALLRAESTHSRVDSASGSQSQGRSQSTAAASTGLKRTYASQRSHLAETNLEDDLMVGLLEDTPKQPAVKPKVFGRSQAKSSKDAFDLDDSDDDAVGTGAIRTIHELRAAGRNIRGTEDIEQLLEDIENQNASHKSRRRSALIELATKLADKNFASRFIGQGCDVRLARQLNTPQDDVASFIIAGAVALLLVFDPPEHTLRTLQDNAVASWLGSLLSSTKEISNMAKDRRYNMARASQTSLIELATLLQSQQSLWSEVSPTVMSTRVVALKALDLLVGKVRRAGDKSELLAPGHLQLVLPVDDTTSDLELETSLAISVLESLSTTSLALAWNPDILQRIAQALTSLDTHTSRGRHTFFLTLRLSLNLTTDNARNCNLHATDESTIQHLLQTVLSGFVALDAEADEETRTLALDLLVLALGILINLFEHSAHARQHAVASSNHITSLVQTFTAGQKRMEEAESVAESISNVALGYLAVVLANLCQSPEAREHVRDALPRKRLAVLGDAVEEFVLFHQQVDGMSSFEGEEGQAVWGGFTEKLRLVLERIRAVEGGGQGEMMQQ